MYNVTKDYGKAYGVTGQHFLKNGQYDQAVSYLEKALSLSPAPKLSLEDMFDLDTWTFPTDQKKWAKDLKEARKLQKKNK